MRPASSWTTRRICLLAFICTCALTPAGMAGDATSEYAERDPYVLHEEVHSHLRDGRIDAAGDAFDQLRRLISASPGWDPDSTFRDRFLPDLERRIERLQAAVNQLDAIYREEWASQKIPDAVLSDGTVRRYLNWTTETVFTLRNQRDAVVNQLDPADRAILYEAPAYGRIQIVLETGVVQRAQEFSREVVKLISEEDERIRALRARLDSLKRDTIDLVAQREQLTQELHMSREKVEHYLEALAALVTEGIGTPSDTAFPSVQQVDEVFFTLLDRRIESMQASASQTGEERKGRLEAVDRYRHYNRVLVRAQLITDQQARIDTLEKLVSNLHVEDPEFVAPGEEKANQGLLALLVGVSAMLAFVLWLIWVRGRRDSGDIHRTVVDAPIDLRATDGDTLAVHDEGDKRPSAGAP